MCALFDRDHRAADRPRRPLRPRASRPRAGALAGLLAGVILLGAQLLAATATPAEALAPVRGYASLIIGALALEIAPLWAVLLAAAMALGGMAAALGAVYAVTLGRGTEAAHTGPAPAALRGIAFGLLVWAVGVQLVARYLYPWFLETSPLVDAPLHAVAYGAPLGLLYRSVHGRFALRRRPTPRRGPLKAGR